MNAASEQLSNPPVLYSWLRHLPTWVQQPSHGLLSLQLPLPRGTIVLQSKGGGGGGGGLGGLGGGRSQWAGGLP